MTLDFTSSSGGVMASWEQELSELADGDADGPLPCGCYRIEVYDFGHDRDRCISPETYALTHPPRLLTRTILERWRPGSGDWSWPAEWAEIAQQDGGTALAGLIGDIALNGITEPVLLGDDGRVWDGHHRLMVAQLLGITEVVVEYGRGGTARA